MERIVAALERLDAQRGLSLNQAKCASNRSFRSWRDFSGDGGVVVLGIAIGTEDFVRRHAAAAIDEAIRIEAAIVDAPLPLHDTFMLFSKCGTHPRAVHLMRATPPPLVAEALRRAGGRRSSWRGCWALMMCRHGRSCPPDWAGWALRRWR